MIYLCGSGFSPTWMLKILEMQEQFPVSPTWMLKILEMHAGDRSYDTGIQDFLVRQSDLQ